MYLLCRNRVDGEIPEHNVNDFKMVHNKMFQNNGLFKHNQAIDNLNSISFFTTCGKMNIETLQHNDTWMLTKGHSAFVTTLIKENDPSTLYTPAAAKRDKDAKWFSHIQTPGIWRAKSPSNDNHGFCGYAAVKARIVYMQTLTSPKLRLLIVWQPLHLFSRYSRFQNIERV